MFNDKNNYILSLSELRALHEEAKEKERNIKPIQTINTNSECIIDILCLLFCLVCFVYILVK